MQATTSAATATTGAGNSLLAGLLGQQNQSAGGLFGLLMALFAQTGGQGSGQLASLLGATQGTGQNVPTTQTETQKSGPILPSSTLLQLAQAAGQNTASGSDLLSWLQNLAGSNTSISPTLQNLLSGGQIDLNTFQQRLAALDDDTRDQVMSEIAALLQPVITPQVLPTTTTTDAADISVDTAGNATQKGQTTPAAPVKGAEKPAENTASNNAPQPDTLLPDAASAADDAAAATAPANTADATSDVTPDTASKAAEAAAQSATLAAKQQVERRNGRLQLSADLAASAKVDEATTKAADNQSLLNALGLQDKLQTAKQATKTRDSAAADASANVAGSAATPTQLQPSANNTATSAGSGKTADQQTAGAIKGIAASGDGNTADNNLRNLANTANNTPLPTTAPVQPSGQTDFASHLQQISLNRTGAHMPVTDQISVQLNRAVSDGKDHFTVKLSPAELGRIEIKIDMSSDGRVTATFHVDQQATLDLLQRDQRGLERSLADAGLKADSGSLNFNLRSDTGSQQQGGQQAQNNGSGNGGNQNGYGLSADTTDDMPAAGTMELTWFISPDRLDVRV